MSDIILNEIAKVNDDGLIIAHIAGFHVQEEQLAIMEAEAGAGLVFYCKDAKQDKAAREWRRKCVSMRTELAELRLSITRPVDVVKKMIIDAQTSIETRCRALEVMADAPIKQEEKRVAEIAAEKARVEAERKQKHQERIDVFRSALSGVQNLLSSDIQNRIGNAELFEADDSFEEFLPYALTAKEQVLQGLIEARDAAIAREDRERVAAETARELEELRKQQAEAARVQAEADRVARIEAEKIAAANAEELRKANARIADHQELLRKQAEQLEAAKAERERNLPAVLTIPENRIVSPPVLLKTGEDKLVAAFGSVPEYTVEEAEEAEEDATDTCNCAGGREALQRILQVCNDREVLITDRIKIIRAVAQKALGE